MSDINIVSIDPITRRIRYSFNVIPHRTSGIEGLLQLCAKTILSTPGSDKFAKNYGGGLRTYTSSSLFVNNISDIAADMAYIISKSENLIKSEQSTKNVPIEERLRSMVLHGVEYLEKEDAIDVRVDIESEAGERANLSLANQVRFK